MDGWKQLDQSANNSGISPSVVSYYLESGYTVQEVAKQLKCRKQKIYDIMRAYNLKAKKKEKPCSFANYSDFYQHFVVEGGSVRGFAEKFGVAPSSVTRWKKKYNINEAQKNTMFYREEPDIDNVVWLKWASSIYTQADIARIANCSQQEVSRKLAIIRGDDGEQ